MKLSSRQQGLVKKLVAFHRQPPTLSRLLFRTARLMAVWAAIVGICVAISGGTQSPLLPYGIGLLSGMLAVNLAFIRAFVADWPVYEAIIDWSKVDGLGVQVSHSRQ